MSDIPTISSSGSDFPLITRRRLVLALGTVPLALAGCGGSAEGEATADENLSLAATPPPPPSSGVTLATLTVHADTSGDRVYLSALYPLEGTVRAGKTLVSPDDGALRCSILSKWRDGSAKVCVLSGRLTATSATTRTVRLQEGDPPAGLPLTAARVQQLVTSVTVEVPGFATSTLNAAQLGSPVKVWWANERVICARYHVPLTGRSGDMLFAAVDIHAFDTNRALVEVQLENSLIDPAAPSKPTTKTFTGANVRVNGSIALSDDNGNTLVNTPVANVTPLGTLQSPTGRTTWADTGMTAYRIVMLRGWVGTDPKTVVTHNRAYLESHPAFYKVARTCSSARLDALDNDKYQFWHMARQVTGGAGSPSITESTWSYQPRWWTDYVRSGDRRALMSVVANGYSAMHYGIAQRHLITHELLNYNHIAGRAQNNYPIRGGERGWNSWDPTIEVGHHPPLGLLPFLCHPSPCFIELQQRASILIAMALNSDNLLGFHAQNRGKAWGMRTHGHAIFLTPDADAAGTPDPWKPAGKALFKKNLLHFDRFRHGGANSGTNIGIYPTKLGVLWQYWPAADDGSLAGVRDQKNIAETQYPYAPGIQQALWENDFLVMCMHHVASMKVLDGADQALLKTHADWHAMFRVRWVNESPNGEWRMISYLSPIGRHDAANGEDRIASMDTPETWGEMLNWFYGRNGSTPPRSPGWFLYGNKVVKAFPNDEDTATWDNCVNGTYPQSASQAHHTSQHGRFMAALACAAERDVPGARAAWNRVTSPATGLPDINYYYDVCVTEPEWGYIPRNL